MITAVYLLVILFVAGIATITSALAAKKGRHLVNWFIIGIFFGIPAIIFLLCSKPIDREKGERDKIGYVLASTLLSVALLFGLKLLADAIVN